MSKYICPNCNHDFKQKSNYIDHIQNKKKPCVKQSQNFTKNEEISQNFTFPVNNEIMNDNINNDVNENTNENACEYCKNSYKNKFTLTRHLTTCKAKKEHEIKNEEKKKETEDIQNKLITKIAELEQKINVLETKKKTINKSKKNIVVEK
jgi:hypothetical protein